MNRQHSRTRLAFPLCRLAFVIPVLVAFGSAALAQGQRDERVPHPPGKKHDARNRKTSEGEGKRGFTAGADGLQYRAPDDKLKLKLGGLFQFDGGGGNGRGQAPGKNSDWSAIARRFRFQFGARVFNDWTLDIQADPTARKRPIGDFNIGYAGLSHAVFTLGNFKEPFSFERAMSSSDLVFLERSVANTLAPRRDFGAGVSLDGDKWTAVAGLFGGNINENHWSARRRRHRPRDLFSSRRRQARAALRRLWQL